MAVFPARVRGVSSLFQPSRLVTIMVRRFAGTAHREQAIVELLERGMWRDDGDAWVITHHPHVVKQGLLAQLKKREQERERERNKRAAEKASLARTSFSGSSVPARAHRATSPSAGRTALSSSDRSEACGNARPSKASLTFLGHMGVDRWLTNPGNFQPGCADPAPHVKAVRAARW